VNELEINQTPWNFRFRGFPLLRLTFSTTITTTTPPSRWNTVITLANFYGRQWQFENVISPLYALLHPSTPPWETNFMSLWPFSRRSRQGPNVLEKKTFPEKINFQIFMSLIPSGFGGEIFKKWRSTSTSARRPTEMRNLHQRAARVRTQPTPMPWSPRIIPSPYSLLCIP